jgi:hypothetical protein
MSIQAPQGILNIPNATLRVGKLAVDSTAGFDTVFNNVERNTILLVDSTEYDDTKQWDLKMPNIFVATFEIKGAGSSFNFRNTSNGDATVGYTLTFSGTTLTLKYDDSVPILATATIPNLDATYGKVYLTYEKQYFTVTVDGTRVLAYKDDVTRTPPDGEYINFFVGTGTPRFQNLKVVAGHLISDGTSNVSLYGGLAVTSNLEVGSSNLFVDTVNSRVGMGTTTPEATLHVSGNAYVSSNLEVGTANLFVDNVNSRVGVGTREPKESLDVVGNMHLTRVSNVSQIKVDANVVTEYTGPHDRPLRKYPEVAMTANDNSSTSGYVADQSSTNGFADGLAYRLFDHSTTAYQSGGSQYSGGDSTSSAQTTTSTDGTTHQGVAITLDLATKIRLSYAKITSHTYYGRTPVEGTFLGSNNNSTWDVIGTFSGLSTTAAGQTHTVHIADYATKSAYRYIRLVVTKIHTSAVQNGGSLLEFRELEYYGHEEGSGSLDTTLKTVYNVPATTGTQLEVYYDGQDYTGVTSTVTDKAGTATNATISNAGGTITFNDEYKAWTFGGDTTRTDTFTSPISSSIQGNIPLSASLWFKTSELNSGSLISLAPSTGEATNQVFGVRLDSSTETDFSFLFWNNDIRYSIPENTLIKDNWYHLTATYDGTNRKLYVNGVRLTVVSTFGANLYDDLALPSSNLQLQLGRRNNGDNEFFGSIANFRLYSKALNADQIKELYDYQKDYFLGSKSQVTLYKGHLGVGVTEPSGQLELAGDERIQEYPPRAMTGYETLVEGHGVFCVSASTVRNSSWEAWEAFDGRIDANSRWISADTYAGTEDAYNGTARLYSSAPLGEYVILKLPYSIKLSSARVYGLSGSPDDNNNRQGPERGQIWGSNDGVTWEHVTNYDFGDYQQDQWNEINNINSMKYYSQYGFIVTKKLNNTYTAGGSTQGDYVAVTEIQYFGTPGPTTLDKGSLSLTRSLDVPRVSRYDVDTETPRPEKLVVDFDTTVNSSPTDISGQGNHGAFYNGAYYSAADKAFVFDGTDDSIRGIISNPAGDWVHSISFWFKLGIDQSTISVRIDPFTIGRQGTGGVSRTTNLPDGDLAGHYSSCDITPTTINWYFYGNDASFNISGIKANEWHHLTFAYEGGGAVANRHAYFDGVEYPNVGTSTAELEMFANSILALGVDFGRVSSSPSYFNGQLSNFKIYNAFLEPSEVKKLYNLGRTGRSMVISDTAVGIGKVPEAQLDVRGTVGVRSGLIGQRGSTSFNGDWTNLFKAPAGSAFQVFISSKGAGGTYAVFVGTPDDNFVGLTSGNNILGRFSNGYFQIKSSNSGGYTAYWNYIIYPFT